MYSPDASAACARSRRPTGHSANERLPNLVIIKVGETKEEAIYRLYGDSGLLKPPRQYGDSGIPAPPHTIFIQCVRRGHAK